jgi:hypothetical protein
MKVSVNIFLMRNEFETTVVAWLSVLIVKAFSSLRNNSFACLNAEPYVTRLTFSQGLTFIFDHTA